MKPREDKRTTAEIFEDGRKLGEHQTNKKLRAKAIKLIKTYSHKGYIFPEGKLLIDFFKIKEKDLE